MTLPDLFGLVLELGDRVVRVMIDEATEHLKTGGGELFDLNHLTVRDAVFDTRTRTTVIL